MKNPRKLVLTFCRLSAEDRRSVLSHLSEDQQIRLMEALVSSEWMKYEDRFSHDALVWEGFISALRWRIFIARIGQHRIQNSLPIPRKLFEYVDCSVNSAGDRGKTYE